ncbi:MAG: hypothetical protein KGD59_11810 [Candidatus Heimdallarchaeota archaeon]|nr:hypothetical protein [Candidatus Heimdallarchaeota archaeon]MBY8995229.1 hypothetical protein [Candidatus Heimdallarchaeota archaeon]
MAGKRKSSTTSKPEVFEETIDSIEEEVVYAALSSQIRRDIISFIYTNNKVGFLELNKKFDVKIGSLYHQLNSMKELWAQDENKKYYLTDLGKVAHNLLILNRDHIASSNVKLTIESEKDVDSSFFKKISRGIIFLFLPRRVFQYLASETLRTFFEGLIIIGAMLYFSIDSQIVLVGFYPLEVVEWYYSLIGVFGLWIFLALMTVGFKAIFYKRKFNPLKLFSIIPFTLIPSLLVLFLIWLQTKVTATFLFLDGQILSIISQVWILPLMTTAVSQTEELTMNRSSLIVLFTFYFTYVIAFVLYGING